MAEPRGWVRQLVGCVSIRRLEFRLLFDAGRNQLGPRRKICSVCLPHPTPGSAMLRILRSGQRSRQNMPAVGYVLEPRPTNDFEYEYKDDGDAAYPYRSPILWAIESTIFRSRIPLLRRGRYAAAVGRERPSKNPVPEICVWPRLTEFTVNLISALP